MGKAEGKGKDWHGHVTAITVAPSCRRIGLADQMMHLLEQVSEKVYVSAPFPPLVSIDLSPSPPFLLFLPSTLLRYNGYFVDLFVRVSNTVAIDMYTKFGYTVYRRVLGYYGGNGVPEADEDAFGMSCPGVK